VPSFSWGGRDPQERYRLQEALRDASTWMEFKGREMDDADRRLLAAVFERVTKSE
jgi:hypothetical protein